jgi:hypothetical protein
MNFIEQNVEQPIMNDNIVNEEINNDLIDTVPDSPIITERIGNITRRQIHDDQQNNILLNQQIQHALSGYYQTFSNDSVHKTQIELLFLLKKAKVPLYVYDDILKWIKNASYQYDPNVLQNDLVSRCGCLTNLYNQYDLTGIQPFQSTIFLKGSKQRVTLTQHSFEQSVYSLLNDSNLMLAENLLLTKETLFNLKNIMKYSKNELNDINTGSVYKKACKIYLQSNSQDVLLPIIFFIDKTHTDTHGRLCLEQIRFTLGIFNRKTRNNPLAWRTIGYIKDQAYIPTETTREKLNDYHQMIDHLLQDYKKCQNQKFKWQLQFPNENPIDVNFVLAVLYIIGDTDGHDKLAGRFTSRTNVARVCRCCNIPFNETDNPEYEFCYVNHNPMFKQIRTETAIQLKEISHHKIKNAWKNINFCDTKRGLFGALCGDILHCIQHGLFMYAHQALFGHKEVKQSSYNTETNDNEENETNTIEYSFRNVFSKKYTKRFEEICLQYGKSLSHQSDRSLPRTHINTNYTTTTRKNANEMTGLLLVILIIFLTDEGVQKLDEAMSRYQAAKFIKVLELLILLDNFCRSEHHTKQHINLFKEFIPFFLNLYKDTLHRKSGCGMKLVKFHLPNHFADDIMRYGSMQNFDTSIGESHHKTEAKYPAKQTQRRKSEFEMQTASRQIEQLAINIGMADVSDSKNHTDITDDTQSQNKWFRYIYSSKDGLYNRKTNKQCLWKDNCFQKQLLNFCNHVSQNNLLKGSLKIFSQHNRNGTILRADPCFKQNEPWYDWVQIQWTNDIIPAKLLLFLQINEEEFDKPFQFADSYIGNAGTYAFIYSLNSSSTMQPAHVSSLMTQYGELDLDKNNEPILTIVECDCIHSCISAVPYEIDSNIVKSNKWIFLSNKSDWYNIYINYMDETVNNYKSTSNKRSRN